MGGAAGVEQRVWTQKYSGTMWDSSLIFPPQEESGSEDTIISVTSHLLLGFVYICSVQNTLDKLRCWEVKSS